MVGTCDRYLPLQMCYPDLWRPVPFRNSDLWVTWSVGFPRINPQVLVGDPDLCSPLKVSSSCHSKVGSTSCWSLNHAGGSSTADNLSHKPLVHKVQGSINMLTMTFQAMMDFDPITKVQEDVVALLQLWDDGILPAQKFTMFKKLTSTHTLAQVYLAVMYGRGAQEGVVAGYL